MTEIYAKVFELSSGIHLVTDTPPLGGKFCHLVVISVGENEYAWMVYRTTKVSDQVLAHGFSESVDALQRALEPWFVQFAATTLEQLKQGNHQFNGNGSVTSTLMHCGHLSQGVIQDTQQPICILCNETRKEGE